MTAISLSVMPLKSLSAAMLSRIWSIEFMPERIVMMFGWLATKRSAQAAGDTSPASAKTFFTLSGGSASRPPRNGSMTVTGTPCLFATSRQARLWLMGFSQSR